MAKKWTFVRQAVVKGRAWGASVLWGALNWLAIAAVVFGLSVVIVRRHHHGLLPWWAIGLVGGVWLLTCLFVGTYKTWDVAESAHGRAEQALQHLQGGVKGGLRICKIEARPTFDGENQHIVGIDLLPYVENQSQVRLECMIPGAVAVLTDDPHKIMFAGTRGAWHEIWPGQKGEPFSNGRLPHPRALTVAIGGTGTLRAHYRMIDSTETYELFFPFAFRYDLRTGQGNGWSNGKVTHKLIPPPAEFDTSGSPT